MKLWVTILGLSIAVFFLIHSIFNDNAFAMGLWTGALIAQGMLIFKSEKENLKLEIEIKALEAEKKLLLLWDHRIKLITAALRSIRKNESDEDDE